ncbi:MAG: cyclodeaminase/cyclohydrolase family protein [Haloarcula sp.]
MTFADQPIGEFLDAVASGQVIPSGGAVAAVGGAMGASLCEMVCIHTLRKDGDDDVSAELADVKDTLASRRTQLLELADEDAKAVDEVQAAFESGDVARIQTASKRSTEVPLEIAELSLDVVENAATVTANGTPVAKPDAAAGALLAHAALRASVTTVRANLDMIDEDEFVTEAKRWTAETEAAAEAALDQALPDSDS